MSRRAISRFLPIIGWLPDCTTKTIRADVIAGIALAGLLVPEGMAYAGIAGVPPQMGLYAAMAGMFAYALFGTSRQLAVTATSSSAAMLAALVAPIAAGDSARYAALASGAAIAAGIIFILGGALRLGAVSEFISKPVLKGFVFGLGLTIMVKQIHKLTGISAGQGNFFHLVWHAITSVKEANPWTCDIGRDNWHCRDVSPKRVCSPSAVGFSGARAWCFISLMVWPEPAPRGSCRYHSGWNALVESPEDW